MGALVPLMKMKIGLFIQVLPVINADGPWLLADDFFFAKTFSSHDMPNE